MVFGAGALRGNGIAMASSTSTEPPTDSVQQDSQLRFLVGVFARQWKLILLLTASSSIVFGAYGAYSAGQSGPPGHSASLELSVKQPSWESTAGRGELGASLLSANPSELLRRIDKTAVAEAILESIHASEDSVPDGSDDIVDPSLTVPELEQKLTFAAVPNTDRVRISVTFLTPQAAARLAQAAADALIDHNQVLLKEKVEKTNAVIRVELAALRDGLETAESAEWDFVRKKGFHTYEEVTKELRSKNDEFMEAQAARSRIVTRLSDIGNEIKKNHETLPTALAQITDSLIIKLLEELEELRKKELATAMVFEGAYPPLQELREEISETEHTVLEAIRRYEEGSGSGANVWDDRQNLRSQHAQLQLDLAEKDTRIERLGERIDELFGKIPEFASNNHEYNRILRDVEGYGKQYERMLERDFELRTAIRAGVGQLERFSPVDVAPASAPPAKILANLSVGALVGLFLAMGLAIMLDMMDTSIRNEEDVKTHLARPIIGVIPNMKFEGRRRWARKRKAEKNSTLANGEVAPCIMTLRDPKSPISEAYRILRTNFSFATVKEHPKTLMITSAVPGEGKTTTAINLAVAMAADGLRVLLIDSDLRRPNVHRMLGIGRNPGLTEVLAEEADVHAVMQAVGVENFLVLPSGHLPANPAEMIGSERMRDLLAQLSREFDIVICDAPSVVVVTDPIVLATRVDAVAMVVSVSNARRETILRALHLLDATSCRLAGIVLNGLEATPRRYYYYYYYDSDNIGRQKRRWYHT